MCATSIHALRYSDRGISPWRHGTRVGSPCWTRAMTSPLFLSGSLVVSVLFWWHHRSKFPSKEVVDLAAKLRSAIPTCILAHGMLGHRSQNLCSVGLLHGRQYSLSYSQWGFMWLQIQPEAVPSCECWNSALKAVAIHFSTSPRIFYSEALSFDGTLHGKLRKAHYVNLFYI